MEPPKIDTVNELWVGMQSVQMKIERKDSIQKTPVCFRIICIKGIRSVVSRKIYPEKRAKSE